MSFILKIKTYLEIKINYNADILGNQNIHERFSKQTHWCKYWQTKIHKYESKTGESWYFSASSTFRIWKHSKLILHCKFQPYTRWLERLVLWFMKFECWKSCHPEIHNHKYECECILKQKQVFKNVFQILLKYSLPHLNYKYFNFWWMFVYIYYIKMFWQCNDKLKWFSIWDHEHKTKNKNCT